MHKPTAAVEPRTHAAPPQTVPSLRALLDLLALAWLVLITIPYASTAAGALAHADFLGASQALPTYVAVIILTVLGLVVGRFGRPELQQLYCRVLLLGAAALVLAILVAGRVAAAAAVVVWLVLLGWALGERVLTMLIGEGVQPRAERAVLSVALALGLYSHGTLVLALLGLLYRWLVLGALLLLSLLVWRDLRDKALLAVRVWGRAAHVARGPVEPWFGLPLLGLATCWIAVIFIESVAPEIQYDSLSYHLALPKTYVEQHALVVTPENVRSWFYLGAEMNYLMAMLIEGQIAAKLINFAFLLLTVSAIFTYGRQFFGNSAGLFGAALYLTTPLVGWEASTTYVEIPLTCYCFLAVAVTVRWLTDRRAAWLIMAGLLAGFAVSTKLNAVLLLVPLSALVVLAALADRRRPVGQRWLPILAFAAAAIVSGAPWPLLRYVQTGNPVFPYLGGVFRNLPSISSDATVAPAYDLETPVYGIGHRGFEPLDYLQLPWWVTFDSSTYAEAVPDGALGLGVLALPLVALQLFRSGAGRFLVAVLFGYIVGWTVTFTYLRFLIPALPIVHSLNGYAFAKLGERGWSRSALTATRCVTRLVVLAWMALSLPLFVASFWLIPERIPYRVALGRESRDAYLTRILATYDAARFIDREYSGEVVHVLALPFEASRLYLPPTAQSVDLDSPFVAQLARARDPAEALGLIRGWGFTHVLINRQAPAHQLQGVIVTEKGFLEANAELEYARRQVELYRLVRDGELPDAVRSSTSELIVNAGFEEVSQGIPTGWDFVGQPILDMSGAHSHDGRAAVHVSKDGSYFQVVPVAAGRIYRLSHQSRSDTPGSMVRVQITWTDARGGMIDADIAVFATTAEWAQHELVATAPLGVTEAAVFASVQVGDAWVDDYSLTSR